MISERDDLSDIESDPRHEDKEPEEPDKPEPAIELPQWRRGTNNCCRPIAPWWI